MHDSNKYICPLCRSRANSDHTTPECPGCVTCHDEFNHKCCPCGVCIGSNPTDGHLCIDCAEKEYDE